INRYGYLNSSPNPSPSTSTPSLKRPRTIDSVTESTSKGRSIAPKFLVVRLKNGDIQKLSPFLLSKALTGVCGELPKVSKPRAGGLLVECRSADQSRRLLSAKQLGEHPITVEAHKTLNSSRRVVFSRDLIDETEATLLEELREQGVIGVHRIQSKQAGVLTPSGALLLTFDTPALPQTVTAGYLRLKVRAYIPSPMRCFKCQRFGHASTSCKGQAACPKSAGAAHEAQEECSAPPKCVNCKGDHPSSDKVCSTWVEEKKVQEIKVKEGLPYAEARKKATSAAPQLKKSFAEAV